MTTDAARHKHIWEVVAEIPVGDDLRRVEHCAICPERKVTVIPEGAIN